MAPTEKLLSVSILPHIYICMYVYMYVCCDSGFGHGLALRLSGLGMQVFAGVLDSEGDGAKKLKEWDPERIAVLQMDVTNPEHIAQDHVERVNMDILRPK
uniref:Uncharacterized protein n=1 Tax=Periophthalmus magnuspinnatus TaxID=409849 RepID=A0A3B4AQT6_9GOBI